MIGLYNCVCGGGGGRAVHRRRDLWPGLPHPSPCCECNSGHRLWSDWESVSLTRFPLHPPSWSLLAYSETLQHAFWVLITAFTPLYCPLGILPLCLHFLIKLSSSFPARSDCHSSLCSSPKLVASKVGVSDLENNFVVTSGERLGEGIDWEFGIDKYTMLYSK